VSVALPSERGRSEVVLFARLELLFADPEAISNQSRPSESDPNIELVNRSLAKASRDRPVGCDDGRRLPASFSSSNLAQCHYRVQFQINFHLQVINILWTTLH